jgi:hypothetical protein
MPGRKSTIQRNATTRLWLGAQVPAIIPANWYIALANAAGEISTAGTGYGRLLIANITANWSDPVDGFSSNLVRVDYADPLVEWVDIIEIRFYDALVAGTQYYSGPVTHKFTAKPGKHRFIPIGALSVQEL